MGRFKDIRALVVATAVVLVAAIEIPATASYSYLPTVGPVPLRFELTTTSPPLLNWKSLRATTGTNAPAPESASTTNEVAAATKSTLATTTVSPVTSTNKTNPETISSPSIVQASPLETSQPTTPQILVEFFKPVPGAKKTDGTAAFVSSEIGFTPPSPKTAPASRATYNSP